MPHVGKRRLSPAALCRIALVLALVLVALVIFHWEEHLPGIPYLREHAHKVQPRAERGGEEVPVAKEGGGEREQVGEDGQVPPSQVTEQDAEDESSIGHGHQPKGEDEKPNTEELNQEDEDGQRNVGEGKSNNSDNQAKAEDPEPVVEDEQLNGIHEEASSSDDAVRGEEDQSNPADNIDDEQLPEDKDEHPEPDTGEKQPDDDGVERNNDGGHLAKADEKLDEKQETMLANGNNENPTSDSEEKPSKSGGKPQRASKPSPPPPEPAKDPLLPPVGQKRNKRPSEDRGISGDTNAGGGRGGNQDDKLPDNEPGREGEGHASGKGDGTSSAKLTDEPCLKYIVYDKPVKTGSSAVSAAIRSYVETLGQTADPCTRNECTEMAQAICAGKQKPRALLGHMFGEDGLLKCLRKRGYYVVTSIREPLARWESAYLFNKKKEGNHYGIPHGKGYKFFMEKFPTCSLYQYYDNTDPKCRQSTSVEDRIKPIVARYDEIIDLYEDGKPRGQLYEIIAKYLQEVNRSPRPEESFREPFNKSRLDNETKLYTALKKRRHEILKKGQAPLCS